MIKDDTWYKCTVCGREGRVGRCCGNETREPLNELAIEEQINIKINNDFKEVYIILQKGKVVKMDKDILDDFNVWMVKTKKHMLVGFEWRKSFVELSISREYKYKLKDYNIRMKIITKIIIDNDVT